VRVLLDYRPALRRRSGVGEYAHELAAALAGKVELTLFSSSWKDRLTVDPALAGVEAVDLRLPVALLNLAWHRLEWPPAETLTGRRFDVAHSSHPLLLPARHAAQVVTIHDLSFVAHPERTRAEIRRDYPALAASHAQRAHHVVVSSPFAAREVERALGVAPDRISVCPAGAPEWPPRHRVPPDGYVLFFGTLEPRKNIGALLDAYERLLDAGSGKTPDLVLAGRATPEAGHWLDRIARRPFAGRVRHIGYVQPHDRRSLYEGARLLVQPSFEEGFGMTVLEAMQVGVPVVASDRGALPDLLGDAGLLIDPDDPAALGLAIRRMLDDEAFAGSCGAKGALRARQYRWGETADRVVEAYRAAIERKSCASA
jgi:glycosyltransferase involved in cell wall biosynthesis